MKVMMYYNILFLTSEILEYFTPFSNLPLPTFWRQFEDRQVQIRVWFCFEGFGHGPLVLYIEECHFLVTVLQQQLPFQHREEQFSERLQTSVSTTVGTCNKTFKCSLLRAKWTIAAAKNYFHYQLTRLWFSRLMVWSVRRQKILYNITFPKAQDCILKLIFLADEQSKT